MKAVWLTREDVIALHDEVLAAFGGRAGVRDVGLLESALAKPPNLADYGERPSLFDLAAAYCTGIAKSHPFIDGNKRTAFLTAAVFLDLDDYLLAPSEVDVVEQMVQVAEAGLERVALSAWFRSCAKKK